MSNIVQLESVGLRYGRGPEVLQDITFALGSGSFHFLTGGSGAGKSSLLSLLYMANRPTRGRIGMFGHEVSKLQRRQLPALRRKVGVVFQDFRLFDHLSTRDNVALPLRIAGLDEGLVRRHVSELLDWVGLAPHAEARPSTLSGGQKQRVAIARAVIARPDLLLADEPTGSVDDEIGGRLMYLFEGLHRAGTTVLIATHNERLVARLGHPVLHLENQRLTLT